MELGLCYRVSVNGVGFRIRVRVREARGTKRLCTKRLGYKMSGSHTQHADKRSRTPCQLCGANFWRVRHRLQARSRINSRCQRLQKHLFNNSDGEYWINTRDTQRHHIVLRYGAVHDNSKQSRGRVLSVDMSHIPTLDFAAGHSPINTTT